jgi:hypothetical protein
VPATPNASMYWSTLFHFGKIVILSTVSIFLIVLLANAQRTNDWVSSRTLCLANKPMCLGVSMWLNAEDEFIQDNDHLVSASVCVRGDVPCVVSLNFTDVTATLGETDVSSAALAAIIVNNVNHNYFYCAFLVVFMCLISLCLTLLFDCRVHVVVRGQFIMPKDSLFMARVNLVLCVVISSLMIESARIFTLMKSERCDDDNASDICAVLQANDLEVRSILRPVDPMVSNYNVFCFCSAAFLLIACVVSYLAHNLIGNAEQQVLPEHDEMSHEVPRRQARIASGGFDMNLAPYWLPDNDPVMAAQQTRCRDIVAQLTIVGKDPANLEGECAICLNRLFVIKKGASKLAWADSKVTSPRGYCSLIDDVGVSPPGSNPDRPPLVPQATVPEDEDSEVMLFSLDNNMIIAADDMIANNNFHMSRNGSYMSRNGSQDGMPISVNHQYSDVANGNVRVAGEDVADRVGSERDISASATPRSPKTQDDIVQLKCGHQFHKNCILQWICTRNSCPVCRAALVPQNADAT